MDALQRPHLVLDERHLRRRHAAERNFRALGLGGIILAGLILLLLVGSIVSKGYSAFWQHYMLVDVTLDAEAIDPSGSGDPAEIAKADFGGLVKRSLREAFLR